MAEAEGGTAGARGAVEEAIGALLATTTAASVPHEDGKQQTEARLREGIFKGVVLPRVRDALATAPMMQLQLQQQPSPSLARALEGAREELAAVGEHCLLLRKQAARGALAGAAEHVEGQGDGGDGENDTWLGGGGADAEEEEEEGSKQQHALTGGTKGFVSLFALYDMPDVVLVDMGAVAERLTQARADEDVEAQLEGLGQLEGVSRVDVPGESGRPLQPSRHPYAMTPP